MSKRAVPALLALLAACHTCPDHEKSEHAVENARTAYNAGNFRQAGIVFSTALEYCPENYDALLGLANAKREEGSAQYASVDALVKQGKREAAQKVFAEANQNHQDADQMFRSAMILDPDDLLPEYGLAQLYYQRATSPVGYPYPLDDALNRRQARDKAIAGFRKLVKGNPDLPQIQRYLGLALFAAGQMQEGRGHLLRYHDVQQQEYNRLLGIPAQTQEEKERKRAGLAKLESDIESIRQIFQTYHEELSRVREALLKNPTRTAAEEKQLAAVATEQLHLEALIRTYQMVDLGASELEVRERCTAYVEALNQGKMEVIETFLSALPGQEAALSSAVRSRVQDLTRYENLRYRSILVNGDQATISFLADVVSRRGRRADQQITLRFRRVSGIWRLTEQP
jgi:tetratricopeptide (TPR) repeat protein